MSFCNNAKNGIDLQQHIISSLVSLSTQHNYVYLLSLSALKYLVQLGSSSFYFFLLLKCIVLWTFFGRRTWHSHRALHVNSTSASCVMCMFTIWHCVHATCFLWMHSAHDTPQFQLLYSLCKHLNVCIVDTHFHFNNFVFFECLTMCIIYKFLFWC